MSHETPNAGVDPLAAQPREGEGIVKWPILAQLPWVGELEPQDELTALPADILPFGEPPPQPYAPPTFNESDAIAPPLRIVDPNLPQAQEDAFSENVDRRLHRAIPAGRPVAEPPHVNVHSFPTAQLAAAPEGGSNLMTPAPIHASSWEQVGPACTWVMSSMRTPLSASIVFSNTLFGSRPELAPAALRDRLTSFSRSSD